MFALRGRFEAVVVFTHTTTNFNTTRTNYSTIVCLLQFSAERFLPPQLESVTAI